MPRCIVHLECSFDEAALLVDHPVFPTEIGALRFSIEEPEHADWLVATFDIRHNVTTRVPRARRILMMTEPERNLPASYVNQFGILVGPQSIGGFTGVWHQSHAALLSRFSFDASGPVYRSRWSHRDLSALEPPAKRDAVSVVVSTKTFLPGHRRRLRLVRALKAELGDRLDVYGKGLREIAVKADAILPYKYHLVLENTVMPSYWTEKLADAYLGFAFPFVSGPPDLARWFPSGSFLPINVDDPAGAAKAIATAIATDTYGARRDAIAEARRRVLVEERLCPLVARVIAAHPDASPLLDAPETVTALPKPPGLRRISREARRLYWQIDGWIRSGLTGA